MRPLITGAGGGGGGHLMEKQSLVPAIQDLWNAWEIHCLILLSLFLQVFLFVFAGVRQRSSRWLPHTLLWLAYLSADSVAVFVLGHLAVRAREPGHHLLSFWAPFVLVHLGGQDTVTAFSKQDNELYWRHLLNLVTQVAVAGYVVGKAPSGYVVGKAPWPDSRLRAAVALVFLLGCWKYAERVSCLCSASPGLLRWWSRLVLSEKLRGEATATRKGAGIHNLRTSDLPGLMSEGAGSSSFSSGERRRELPWDAIAVMNNIISVDAPLNQTHNITAAANDDLPGKLEEFLSSESRHDAYEHVGVLLGLCYRRLYTKDRIQGSSIVYINKSPVMRLMVLGLGLFTWVPTLVALALFMAAEKHAAARSSRADIWVSYLLLVGALVLDASSTALFIFSLFTNYNNPEWYSKKQWSQEIGQYNMIKSAGMGFVKRQISCDVTRQSITKDHNMSINKFILDTLLVSGTKKEWNIASTRGQLALRKWTALKALEATVGSGFDFPTSVLIWHIATDMCYYYSDDQAQAVKEERSLNNVEEKMEEHKQKISRELSQYVMYLVFKCGVMLTINSEVVHDKAEEEIVDILSHFRQDDLGEKDAVIKLYEAKEKQQQDSKDDEIQQIERRQESEEKQNTDGIQMEREESSNIDSGSSYNHMKKLEQSFQALESSVLPRARAVAQELMSIKDEVDRWDLIAAVWAEMLYYTAARCGGDFHYERLSTGGEFATHVLVLMYLLGPFLPPAYQ